MQSHEFHKVLYEPFDVTDREASIVDALTESVLECFPAELLKNAKKITSQAMHIFRGLGCLGFQYFLSDGVVPQLRAQLQNLAGMLHAHSFPCFFCLFSLLWQLRLFPFIPTCALLRSGTSDMQKSQVPALLVQLA